jgi:hypothetical protein
MINNFQLLKARRVQDSGLQVKDISGFQLLLTVKMYWKQWRGSGIYSFSCKSNLFCRNLKKAIGN